MPKAEVVPVPHPAEGGKQHRHEEVDKQVARVLRELIPKGSRAEFIDHGSEKLVFKFNPPEQPGKKPSRQSIVYKIDYRRSLFREDKKQARVWDQPARVEMLMETQEAIEQRKQELKKLREVFGFNAVPPEKSMVQLLPMSADLYNAIKRHDMDAIDKTPERIPALVTIQKRIDIENAPVVDLSNNYAETPRKREGDEPEMDQETYETVHRRLIGDLPQAAEHTDPHAWEQAVEECLAMYPGLQDVIPHLDDPAFHKQLEIAARGLVTYANDPEGTVLDIAGGHNVVIAEKPGTEEGESAWQLYLLDALSPGGEVNLTRLPGIAERLLHGKTTSNDRIEALNALHMVRMANALAILAKIPDRARLSKEVRQIPSSMWREFLEEAWSKEERLEASQPGGATRVASPPPTRAA